MDEDKTKNGGYESEGSPLVGLIREKFQQAETSKIYDERRWLKAYRNYRGLYGPEMAFRENEKSRVFVKVTKTKVLASFGQIIEVLFSQGKFPLGVTPTSVPEDIAEKAHLDPQQAQQAQQPQEPISPYGFNGDGGEIPPGATVNDLMKNLEYKNEFLSNYTQMIALYRLGKYDLAQKKLSLIKQPHLLKVNRNLLFN